MSGTSLMEARDLAHDKAIPYDGATTRLSANPYQNTIRNKGLSEGLQRKWGRFLKGLEEEMPSFSRPNQARHVKGLAAFMMESQAGHLVQKKLHEDAIRTGALGAFLRYIFPVIRRSAIKMIATEIASVQPMLGPIGGVAFLKPRYGSNKGLIRDGDEMNAEFDPWYSHEYVDGEDIGLGNGAETNFNGKLKFNPVKAGTLRVIENNQIVGVDDGSTGAIINLAGNLAGGAGAVDYSTGQIALTFGTAPANGSRITITYSYDMELNPRIPEYRLDVTLKSIEAKTRKATGLASVEARQDLAAHYGADIDQELVGIMADDFAASVDREIERRAFRGVLANNRLEWDRHVPGGIDEQQHFKSLTTKLSTASQLIYMRVQRGAGANWMVTSPGVAAILDTMDNFQVIDDGYLMQGGIAKLGVLRRRWNVYVDPKFPPDEILLGYQGPSILDTGIIYSPYIPLEITPNFVDPRDFSIRRSVMSRYEVTLVRPEFFARIKVKNLT